MSQKKIKQLRRKVRQYESDVKIEGLKEFFKFAKTRPLRKRIRMAFKIIFKRL